MLIHRDALCVASAVEKVASSYFIGGALFDAEGRAIATNGRTLVRYTSKPCPVDSFPQIDGLDVNVSERVIVSLGTLKAARATMADKPAVAALGYFAVVPNGTHATIAATNLHEQVQIRTRKIDAVYPNYENVLTNAASKPVTETQSFSIEELEVLVRAAKFSGARYIKFTFHGDNQPVEIHAKAENGEIDGAIMPSRP